METCERWRERGRDGENRIKSEGYEKGKVVSRVSNFYHPLIIDRVSCVKIYKKKFYFSIVPEHKISGTEIFRPFRYIFLRDERVGRNVSKNSLIK